MAYLKIFINTKLWGLCALQPGPQIIAKLRSTLIHFTCIGVAPCAVESRGGETPMQAKRIKFDLRKALI